MNITITEEGFSLFVPDEEVPEFLQMVESAVPIHFTRDLKDEITRKKVRGLIP